MNEMQLMAAQLRLERSHALALARACAGSSGGPPALREAAAAYLARILGWFQQRDARLVQLAQRRAADEPGRSLGAALAVPADSAAALALLAEQPGQGWQVLARFLEGPWSQRREALEQWLRAHARVADWRTVTGLTAEVILEERGLWSRAEPLLPGKAAPAAAGSPP